jgi:Protein of unknown function (DUF1236)
MMKTLLATTAAVALAAGMSIAAAQGTGGSPGASGGTGAGGASHGQMEKQSGAEGKGGSEQKGERTGQKAGEKNERTGQKNEEKNERMGQKPGEKNERTGQGERNERTGTAERQGGSSSERLSQAKSVQLSSEQRTRIKTVVTSHREARVDHVDFSVSVGTRVPRSVHIVALPEEIIRIVPQYRGFDYIVVRNEILIIDPDTLEIVAVIPA